MTSQVLLGPHVSEPDGRRRIRLAVALTLVAWFLLVISFGAGGAFTRPPGKPPLPIAIGVAAPLLLFFAWMQLSPAFREFVLSLDLRLIAAIQAWRFAGLGFVFLYAYNVLPAVSSLPAGLGDMAIGLAAPWMVLGLVRDPGFATRAPFMRWNLLGILDLVIAVGLGASSAMFATGVPGEISSARMATLPLLLIPAFLVPFFLMLHTSALLQRWRLMRNRA